MDSNTGFLLPPYAIVKEKHVEKLSSINDLRCNIPSWYRRHKKLEALHDDPFGFPQELPPSTDRWKTMGIPARTSEPYFSHVPFSDMYTNYDRKRIDPETGRYVLSTDARYGLEEVYHRLYCAKKELNPFLRREQTRAAVRHKLLNQENQDCLNVQRKQLLAEADARKFKSSAPFHVQRDSPFVTQAGDFNFQTEKLNGLNENELINSVGIPDAIGIVNKDQNYWKFNAARHRPKPGSKMYEKNSILESKVDINERQKEIRNAITGNKINVKSGNDQRLTKLLKTDENEFKGLQDVKYVEIPTEEYMKEIGVGGEPSRITTYKDTLVQPPDHARVILSRGKDNWALDPAPVYHPMVWKTQLNRDYHAIYPDQLPKEDLCTKVVDVLEMKMKYKHYHYLDSDLTALKLKLILK